MVDDDGTNKCQISCYWVMQTNLAMDIINSNCKYIQTNLLFELMVLRSHIESLPINKVTEFYYIAKYNNCYEITNCIHSRSMNRNHY